MMTMSYGFIFISELKDENIKKLYFKFLHLKSTMNCNSEKNCINMYTCIN